MRLSRLFGGKSNEPDPPEPPEPPDDDGADSPSDDDFDGIPEGDPTIDHDLEWRDRAADVIPGGASTGSKRAVALYGENTVFGPTHFVRASGCHVSTPGGRTLIDCTMALGAVAIGYADDAVTRHVLNAIAAGHVSGLSHTSEIDVADRLCDMIPCAEQVRFLKTGAEAVSAAVRIARTHTGRNKIVCSGYFGWHDWANEDRGVPAGAHVDTVRVPFDDVAALEQACEQAGRDLAAIILEPVIERLPSKEWIEAARRLADDRDAVLVFDEIKTGFRLRPGGYQDYASVEPDMATFGKAMANGFPIAAVVGRAGIMEAAAKTWISSTLASEAMSLAAVAAVLEMHDKGEVCDTLWRTGEEMMGAMRRAISASGVQGVTVEGIAPMWFLRWDSSENESRFLDLAIENGVLFKRGAYNFAAVAHDEQAIIDIEAGASTALVQLVEETGVE
ncbi:MAG TPA: aminotransferase class III-fold pyridoxal phosphate-dependent enzyme [Gemmatimonadaceae bacterium]|nr:aminotransferase class III-fold pyridoxal phosphate-dependent enzyme [Gemmatimonadaceae bacterium]